MSRRSVPDLRSQIAFGFELRQNLGGVVDISGIEGFSRALQARSNSRGVENIYGFAAQGFLQAFREFLGAGEAIEGFLGQRLVDDLADGGVHGRIKVRDGRRRVAQNGLSQILLARDAKGVPPREHLVSHHRQRELVGERRRLFALNLFRRHVQQRALEAGGRTVIGQVGDAEVDDLYRIILQNEQIARLQIAMNQVMLVRRLEAPACLRQHLNGTLHRQPRTGGLDQFLKGHSRQERHHEVGASGAAFFHFPDVEDFDDIGVAHAGQDGAFPLKKLEYHFVLGIANGFDRDLPVHHRVQGSIHDAHPPLAEDVADLVSSGGLHITSL